MQGIMIKSNNKKQQYNLNLLFSFSSFITDLSVFIFSLHSTLEHIIITFFTKTETRAENAPLKYILRVIAIVCFPQLQ